MARVLSTMCSILVFLAFAAVGTMVHNVQGSICTQGLGICGNDCDARCRSIHSNGQGSCDYNINIPLCNCYYDCGSSPGNPPPEPKRNCNAGFGPCSVKCNDQCCNANCASKYNQGQGFCNSVGTINVCQCKYVC